MRARVRLVAMFRDAGFILIRQNGHMIWACPCGHARVVTSTTPGEGRGDRNAKAEMNRALRGCADRAPQTARETA